MTKNGSKKDDVAPWFYVRDAGGHKSVSVTLVVVSFFVTTVAFVLSLFSRIGSVEIRQFDVAACGTYLVPILSLYFGRRWSDGAHGITQARDAAQLVNRPAIDPGDPGDVQPTADNV